MCSGCEKRTALEEFKKRLESFVNRDTPSGCKEALDRQSEWLRQEFLAVGCRVTTVEQSGGNLLECRLGHGSKQILLLGHMDTVFAVGTAARRPFRMEGNRLYGPGVLDMKSGVLMILEVMRHFSGKLSEEYSLCALLNCDEEVGSVQSRERITELGRNSVACLCMEPSKPGYCTVARKGLITFRITTHGVAAHSGVNYHLGFSAIQGICNIITRLYGLRDDQKGVSVNIGGIQGGTEKGNIVADHATCIGEIRFYEPEQTASLLEVLKEYSADSAVRQVDSELEIISIRPPMQQTPASAQLYELARRAAEKNGLSLLPRTHGGGSDGSFVSAAGIPVVDGLGAEGEFSHTDQEYVLADTLMPRLSLCIDLIQMLVKQ